MGCTDTKLGNVNWSVTYTKEGEPKKFSPIGQVDVDNCFETTRLIEKIVTELVLRNDTQAEIIKTDRESLDEYAKTIEAINNENLGFKVENDRLRRELKEKSPRRIPGDPLFWIFVLMIGGSLGAGLVEAVLKFLK